MKKPLLLTSALIAVGFCSSFFPAAIEGQGQMARFGVVMGKTTSDQLWTPSVGTASRDAVSYTHLRAHETRHGLVCRLLLE